MALTWPSKESAEDLDFEVDWATRLAGDTIASFTLTVAAGAITIGAQTNTASTVTGFFAGGTAGETCVVICEIETNAGRTMEETIILPIAAQEETYSVVVDAVYRTAEDVDRYMVSSFGAAADAWLAATAAVKQRAAATATRVLDRQEWAGRRTAFPPDQMLAFPRTGLTWPDGSPVPPNLIPTRLLDAVCELAGALVAGSDVQDTPDQFQGVKTLKAGPAEITYFRREDQTYRFPLPVQELIGLWLGGPAVPGSASSGTCGRSIMGHAYDFTTGF